METKTVRLIIENLTLSLFCYRVITDYHDDIKSQVWLTVDFEEMEETCDNHMNSLTELGECSIEWDIRIHLEEAVKELQVTI